jgi:hypothetical protein
MRLIYLPTLADMRDMLGEQLYVDLVWMWRERDQWIQAQDRRAKWGAALPARRTESWPKPLFVRPEQPVETPSALNELKSLLRPMRPPRASAEQDAAPRRRHG